MHQTLLNQAIFCFTFLYFEKIKNIYMCVFQEEKRFLFHLQNAFEMKHLKKKQPSTTYSFFSFYVSEKYLPVSFFLFSFYICISLNMSYKLTEIEFKNCIFSLTMKNTTINICKYLLFLLYIIVFLVNFLYYK